MNAALDSAHSHSFGHRKEIEASTKCGCFFCCATYQPAEIIEWVDGGQTALCPRCGIDTVIGDASGLAVMKTDFLEQMKRRWFSY